MIILSLGDDLFTTLLNQGYKYCFLFTDLANPISNHIYQAIGYQPVNDWYDYSFTQDIAIDDREKFYHYN